MFFLIFYKESIENFCKESIGSVLSFIKRTLTVKPSVTQPCRVEIKFPASNLSSRFSDTVVFSSTVLIPEPKVAQSGIKHEISGFFHENWLRMIFSFLVGLFINYVAPTLFCG